jgi:hypothetical protein
MSEPSKKHATARCACGSVELQLIGAPIVSSVCYCDSCQQGSRQIEALPDARPVLDPDGGTAYVLYRKDRMRCSSGAPSLREYRIKEGSPTSRVVATCCNSAMYLTFEKGHWFSVYRGRLQGDVPPVQMRIQTKFRPDNVDLPSDVPSYPAFPVRFLAKLVAARIAMLLRR